MDEIFGVNLETLADIQTKDGELRAQYGEARGRQELARFLAERGLTENVWASAHNGWWERFRADPTGMLEARFHQMLSQRSVKAHFGDVRDMTEDAIEGVTLDQYAQLCVAMAQPGIDAEAVARQHGLADAARWMVVNAAWAAKMSQDTTHVLTTQFGTLYQKHAGPAFAQQQLEQTAAILASANQPRDVVKTKEVDHSQPTLLAQLRSDSRKERWEAARWLAHRWRKGDPSTQANLECIPVLIEVLEQHDEHTVSNAEDAVRKLTSDLEQYTDEVKSAMTRCSNRAKEKLATLQAAFAPIQDKAVPERVVLQARIQEYQSLVDTLEGVLRSWPVGVAAGRTSPGRMASSMEAPRAGGGFPKALLAVAVVLAAGGGFFLWRTMASSAAPDPATSTPAISAATSAPATPPPPPPALPAATKPEPVGPTHAAPTSSHAPAKPKDKH
jgi:hypothetical protein